MGKDKRAPIKYFGGKGNMIAQILSYFPPTSDYDTFVDAYGGAGTVLLNKPRTALEVYNDLDQNVYNLFQCLTNPTLFAEFRQLAELALYDETTSLEYKRSLRKDDLSVVQRAFRFWYVSRTRRSGAGGFSMNGVIRRGMSKSTSDFLSSVEGLEILHARLSPVIVCNRDAIELIEHHDRPRTLIYLDPPYVQSTRNSTTRYTVDQKDEHHERLITTLRQVRHAYIVLSGYDNAIYNRLLMDGSMTPFTQHHFTVKTQSGTNEAKDKTEFIWRNFAPMSLTLSMFDILEDEHAT